MSSVICCLLLWWTTVNLGQRTINRNNSCITRFYVQADFKSVEFSKQMKALLFTIEDIALIVNRKSHLSNLNLLCKVPAAQKIPPTGSQPLDLQMYVLSLATLM